MRSRRSQLSSSTSATVRRCCSFTFDASRTSTVDSRSGSSSSSSTNARHRSSNAMRDEISSRTSMRGGRPTSIGNSVRMRCANACNVQIAAASRSSSAARHLDRPTPPRSGSSARCAQLAPDAVAELGRGLLRERDRRDRAGTGNTSSITERDDAVDERLGLAGSRAGLDEQGGVELACRSPRVRRVAGFGDELEIGRHQSAQQRRCDEDRGDRFVGPRRGEAAEHRELRGVELALPVPPAVGGAHAVGVAVRAVDERCGRGLASATAGTPRPRCRRRSFAASSVNTASISASTS